MLYAVAACRRAAAPSPAPSPSFESEAACFYPLAVGNSWTYQGRMLGVRTRRSVRIVKEQAGVFHDNMGAALRVDRHGLRDTKRYILRGPLEKGTKWISVTSVQAVEHYKIVATGKPVTVPAGTFHGCVVVRASILLTRQRQLVNELTFAPRVGIIRIQTTMVEHGNRLVPQVDLKLHEYTLCDT